MKRRPVNGNLPRPLDIMLAEAGRCFRKMGVVLPVRLLCENDEAFLKRIARLYPEVVAELRHVLEAGASADPDDDWDGRPD
jgi:hypothetical protein